MVRVAIPRMIIPTVGTATRNVLLVIAVKKEPAHSIAPADSPTVRAAVRMFRSTHSIVATVRLPARLVNYVPRANAFPAVGAHLSIVVVYASTRFTTLCIAVAVMLSVQPDTSVPMGAAS